MDVRDALPDDDFTYLPIDEAHGRYTTHWREVLPGRGIYTEPQLGCGSHGSLIQREAGNIAFELPLHAKPLRRLPNSVG